MKPMVPLHISPGSREERDDGKIKRRKEIQEREKDLGVEREEAEKKTAMMGEGWTAGWKERKSKRQQRTASER